MTPWSAEQISAVQQANLAIVLGLTSKALEGFEKLVTLNLQAMKSTLAETRENAEKALGAGNQQEFLALQASLLPQIGEKALSYQRHVFEIGTATQAGLPKSPKRNMRCTTAGCRSSWTIWRTPLPRVRRTLWGHGPR